MHAIEISEQAESVWLGSLIQMKDDSANVEVLIGFGNNVLRSRRTCHLEETTSGNVSNGTLSNIE